MNNNINRPRNVEHRDPHGSVNDVPVSSTSTPAPLSPPVRPTSSSQLPSVSSPRAESPVPLPRDDTPPYEYEHIDDERLGAWEVSGREEVVEIGSQAQQEEDIMTLSCVFQELIRSALDSRIRASDAGSCVKAIIGPDTAPAESVGIAFDSRSLFLDTFAIIAEAEVDKNMAHPLLRKVATSTGIDPALMRQTLDGPILESLSLARDTFVRMGVRKTTNLLYRQANYNLLREETEGYSKLMTELFTTTGREAPSSELVEDTFEKVKGLIGTFDLDVGRVLDVTLDVFAAVLVKQFRFFIKFLRVSSWWPRERNLAGLVVSDVYDGSLPSWALPGADAPQVSEAEDESIIQQRQARDTAFWDRAREIGLAAFFELGGRRVVDKSVQPLQNTGDADAEATTSADEQWIEATGTLPPSGNHIAAQLLGFKLRFYASPARDAEDVLPANLIYLAALLIKVGFISLRDLYPHLWPLDENMEAVKEKAMREMAERDREDRFGGGSKNALMMAGALVDDTLPPVGRVRDDMRGPVKADDTASSAPKVDEPEKEKLPEPVDQKVQLLINLLTIGALPEALFMLGRFPWLPEAFPEILDLIHRILHKSIDKVHQASRPISTRPDSACPAKPWPDPDQSGVPKGNIRFQSAPTRKPLKWPYPEKFDTNECMIYKFYWDEWADDIPVCQTEDDFFTLCDTFLNISGVSIGRDASLLSKIAAIGSRSLAENQSEVNRKRWHDLLKRIIVPALSLTKGNTSVVNEIYGMLRYFSTPIRYAIYAEWYMGRSLRDPAMKRAFERTRRETISVMKRISKTNLTAMARSLAKIAYASPGIVFLVALQHIESYTNLVDVVVECARYFTDLGYDVLIWSMMSSMGGEGRSRLKDGGTLVSDWLQALALFAGKVFKRYSIMNVTPILQYVNLQLQRGISADLVVLEQIVASMAGVVSGTDFTDAQLTAMTGGEVLRRQTLISLQDKRYESTKTSKRFMRALTDHKLAGQIIIGIAQQRQSAVYAVPDEDAHVKLLSTMLDEAQRVFVQYLDLLRSNLSPEAFDDLVPDVSELITKFGLEVRSAFYISRASISHRMAKLTPITNGKRKSIDSSGPVVDSEGDVGMQASDAETPSPMLVAADSTVAGGDPDVVKEDVEMSDVKVESAVVPANQQPWHEILKPIMSTLRENFPEEMWQIMSPGFFVTFWQLSLSDLQVPAKSYDAEIARLMREQADIMRDRLDRSEAGIARKEEAKKHLASTADTLRTELKQQIKSFEHTKNRLTREKPAWFVDFNKKWDSLNDGILEYCIFPRAVLSTEDATYCFKLIKYLHTSGTPNFRTLGFYSHLFRANRLRTMIFLCTTREADHFGRFLKEVLGDLSRWHADKTIYEREAFGSKGDLPGFAKLLSNDGKPKTMLDYEDFRRILSNWHKQLNSALRTCLSGNEWTHIRNAISILQAVVQHFPAMTFMGKHLFTTCQEIGVREKKKKREDISLAANAVLAGLKKRESAWVLPQEFANNKVSWCQSDVHEHFTNNQQNDPPLLASEPTQASTKPASPMAETPATTLKPTAPEFKPQAQIK